jgi:GTPase Era involved in 16S rRNA processing
VSRPALRLAVVGHTNTGKTSLLRTLTRDIDFGEVSPRPATTRRVEGTSMLLDGRKVMELYDTPGLEDSIALLRHIEQLAAGRRVDGLQAIRAFLESDLARGRFAQEAKAIRQVLDCDAALYVIDARDRVLGKHRDELEILARCARPVVPVLNFIADPGARVAEWREHLARAGMHAVAEFDTWVVDETAEERLFEKMKTLLDAHATGLDALIEDRRTMRESMLRASAGLVADLLIDAAALVLPVPAGDTEALRQGLESLRQVLRDRESFCIEQLLRLHRFRIEDFRPQELPLVDGRFGLDLFSPLALKQFGLRTGSAAAAGAMVGLVLDVMAHGLSLGAGTAAGAAVGGVLGAARTHGRRLFDRVRGTTELRCDDLTLRLLALRQVALVEALFRRGHASMAPVGMAVPDRSPEGVGPFRALPAALRRARSRPAWCAAAHAGGRRPSDPARAAAQAELAEAVLSILRCPRGAGFAEAGPVQTT